MPTLQQFTGCLLGQCVGDALGYVIESKSPEECQAYVDNKIRTNQLADWSGQYSDDSQLARELMISYADRGVFNPVDYADRIRAIFSEGRIVGPGRGALEAAARLEAGVPWDQAGTPAPSAGNGTAMRVAPIGLFFAHDHTALIRAAEQQARITHLDPRCTAGAIAIAGTVTLTYEGDIVPEVVAEQVSDWCRPFDPVLADALLRLPGWLDNPLDVVLEEVKSIGDCPAEWTGWPGIPVFVTPSVLWSLYAFLKSPASYVDAITTAMAGGGDVDTTAAMTGALSGARLSLDAVPADWTRLVNDRGTWTYDDLITLAHKCYEISYVRDKS